MGSGGLPIEKFFRAKPSRISRDRYTILNNMGDEKEIDQKHLGKE